MNPRPPAQRTGALPTELTRRGVLHYFFIEYSLTFLSATQLIGIFFSGFFMFTPYRIAFAPPRESYRIQLLVTQKNGDFGAIFVTERSRESGAAFYRVFVGTYRNQAV